MRRNERAPRWAGGKFKRVSFISLRKADRCWHEPRDVTARASEDLSCLSNEGAPKVKVDLMKKGTDVINTAVTCARVVLSVLVFVFPSSLLVIFFARKSDSSAGCLIINVHKSRALFSRRAANRLSSPGTKNNFEKVFLSHAHDE